MPDLTLIAFIGLLLLVPLEILFLVMLALIKPKSRFLEPVLNVPEVRKVQRRYGWEDYLKLPPEKKPSGRKNQAVIVALIAILGLLVIGPAYIFFPSISTPANATSTLNGTPAVIVNAGAVNLTLNSPAMPQFLNFSDFANISVSHSFAFPSLSFLEGSVSSYTPYIATAVLVIAILVVCLAAFLLFLRSKRNAVLKRAKKTAEKLIRKDSASPKFVEKLRPYFFPAVVLLLLVVISFLIYILRLRIRSEFAPWFYASSVSFGSFLLLYRFYLLAGMVFLVGVIAFLRYISSRQKKQ